MTPSTTNVTVGPDMAGRTYRITVAGSVSASFHDAFPNITTTHVGDGELVLEGVVADPAQLAGIVNAICHRDTPVTRLEVVDHRCVRSPG